MSDKAVAALEAGLQEAQTLGLRGTPSVAVNGFHYGGNRDLWTLSAIVELLKLEQRDYTTCPPTVIDESKSYQATLTTTKGDIVIELLPKKAPLAVNSFVFLAREGWYNDVPFHRVISGFMAQTGDPSGTGYGGPGYTFRDEVSPEDKFDAAGLVAMANAGANSNGSQFFITYGPQETLDGKHTIPALDRVGKGALDRSISRQGKACGVIGVHAVGAHHARLRPAGRRRGFDHGIGAPRIQRAAIPTITVTEREHVIRRIRGRVRPGYRKVETNPVRIGTRISNLPHDDLLQGNPPWRDRRRRRSSTWSAVPGIGGDRCTYPAGYCPSSCTC